MQSMYNVCYTLTAIYERVVSSLRRKYLDNLRSITVILVVLYHVFYIFNGSGVLGGVGPITEDRGADILLYLLYPWFMFLLFAVSGMSARYSLECRTHRAFIRAETRKLLLPSTVGLFVFWWILGYFNVRFGGAFDHAAIPLPIRYLIYSLSGTGPLWYIQMLWLFSLGLVLIRKLEKDRLYRLCEKIGIWLLPPLFFAVWSSAQILNTPVVVVYRFGFYGLAYLIGYFVFSHDAVIEKLKKLWLPLCLAAVAAEIAFTVLYFDVPYTDDAVLRSPLCCLCAWVTTLAALAVMKRWGDVENAFFAQIKKRSWGLYLFHYLPLAVCADVVYHAPFSPFVKYLLTALCAFAGAIVLYEVLSRIPFVRTVVCGIGKGSIRQKKNKTQN